MNRASYIEMYIAFKWLLGLTLAMWISMCGIDVFVKRSFEIKQEGFNQKMLEITRNTTIANRKVALRRDRYYKKISDKHSVVFLPFSMFLAGALAVSLFNKKAEIVSFTKRETSAALARLLVYSKITSSWLYDCSIKYSNISWIYLKNLLFELWNQSQAFIMWKESQKPRINMTLLKKLQEVSLERKKIGQLLVSAVHENKSIRMQYELENMAKNRLVRHIENTQKLMKENRSSYVSFQQLYTVTHQENSFLKCRINKLIKEKEEAENNLIKLMNEVYKSKNNQLKVFCSRFLVKTADNLLNSDIGAEIQKFLDKTRSPVVTTSNREIVERPNAKINSTGSCPLCAHAQCSEIIQDDILVPLVSNAPKLKGLPGEFVWTVKDKDGLISKLYEYDFTSELDDGDTEIKRIRQYSVYFDKDCLLDSINSKTVINNESSESRPAQPRRFNRRCDSTNYPITTQRFLTGSQAFQKFMKNTKNNALTSKSANRMPGPTSY